MIKCDFCSYYDPIKKRCSYWNGAGGYQCEDATKRFLSFQRSRNSRTHTKNINVNKKSYHKKYNGKKR